MSPVARRFGSTSSCHRGTWTGGDSTRRGCRASGSFIVFCVNEREFATCYCTVPLSVLLVATLRRLPLSKVDTGAFGSIICWENDKPVFSCACFRLSPMLNIQIERPLLGVDLASSSDCNGSLCRALHSDPYAHVSTMHRDLKIAGAGPCSDEVFRPAMSAHSYSVCRNRSSESGAL